ncbi:MAG TPA: aminotransferase class I/II-fold pyridoxal phosphate-dependent enzyme, partial [Caulobacteraceae bacterium]|nr:aminotransferase class I/II-fold pyridoxal phosphate-dependent enzyme [Caulobacteraceae bacterium]
PDMVLLAGGEPVTVVGHEADGFKLKREALEAAITERTRMVVLNNPHNPAAVVFSDEELAVLAELCVRHDVIAVCDEVWEQVMLDGRTFWPLMSFPGMRERCVKIGSAGKLFAMTGWKVGWLVAAPELMKALAGAHQFLTFTTPPNLQTAVAWGLANCADWFEVMPAAMTRARDRLAGGLTAQGFSVLPAQGTYFVNLDLVASGIAIGDYEFAMRAVKEAGVGVIPVSVFYDEAPVTSVVRLCFAKRDGTLDAGVKRLAKAKRLFA